MTDGPDKDVFLEAEMPESDTETPASGKLKFDSFGMERGPGLRFDRGLDRRTGEVELPSRRRMQEYRKAHKEAEAAKEKSHGSSGNAIENASRVSVLAAHTALSYDEDDSAAADAVHEGEYAAMYATDSGYSSKRKTYSSYSEPTLKDKAEAVDSASKKIQKKEIQKGYHSTGKKGGSTVASAGKKAAKERKAAKKAEEGTKDTAKAIGKFIKEHPMAALAMAGILFLVIISASMCSTCTSFFAGGGGVVSATSITADEKDALSVELAYLQMEQEKAEELEAMRNDYLENGINSLRVLEAEVRYEPDIGHDPYELAAFFTVLYGDYKESKAKNDLRKIFAFQYETGIDVTYGYADPEPESTEAESDEAAESGETDPSKETAGEKERCAKIVITLKNHGIRYAAERMGFTEEQMRQFDLLVYTKGNRPDLFDGYEYSDYEVPPKYLADKRFAAIYAEAKKHLGTSYVWGGESPTRGFDCSGYVSYVLNHSGLYSFERTDCNGLLSMCTKVNRGGAKPGDLVFFEGTQDKYGATHVGIYLGGNMMIHAARPSVRYISLDNQYLKEHFMTFGRMPEEEKP